MLEANPVSTFTDIFKTRPLYLRQLVAFSCLAGNFNAWDSSKFLILLKEAEITNESGNYIGAEALKKILKDLEALEFIEFNGNKRSVPVGMRHKFLMMMQDHEMQPVYFLIDEIYGITIPDFQALYANSIYYYDNSVKIEACLIKAYYANDSSYFLNHQGNPFYFNRLSYYFSEIFEAAAPNIQFLKTRHPIIQFYISNIVSIGLFCDMPARGSGEIVNFFTENSWSEIEHDLLHYYSALIHLSLSNWDKMKLHAACIKDTKSGHLLALQATIAFFAKQFQSAADLYGKALAGLKKYYRSPNYYFDNILGIFHSICECFINKNMDSFERNLDRYDRYASSHFIFPMSDVYPFLQLIPLIVQGEQEKARNIFIKLDNDRDTQLSMYLNLPVIDSARLLLKYMIDQNLAEQEFAEIYNKAVHFERSGFKIWAHILFEIAHKSPKYQQHSAEFLSTIPWELRFLEIISIKEAWEYRLEKLEDLLLEEEGSAPKINCKRLLWLVDPAKQKVDVLEQQVGKSGNWTKGKHISLRKLMNYSHYTEEFEYLGALDKRLISCINENYVSHQRDACSIDSNRALLELVGHKKIAHAKNTETFIELKRAEPELYIEEKNKNYHLTLSHWLPEAGVLLAPESLNTYSVIDFSSIFVPIGKVLTKKGLTVPLAAKDKIVNLIKKMNKDIQIQVDIKGVDIPEITGDSVVCVQIQPIKQGVILTLWAKPLPSHGVYFKIGKGKASVILMLGEPGSEIRTRVTRKLTAEKSNLKKMLSLCPKLLAIQTDQDEYITDNPLDTLELLSELQAYSSTNSLLIEWPQGQTFKIKQQIGNNALSLKIASEQNWFAYSGEVALNDGDVLNMQDLLQSLRKNAHGRFIQLANGEFLELTTRLKNQLELLEAISDGNHINPLGAQILSDIAAEAEHTVFDEGWQAHLNKLEQMKSHQSKVPETLHASLRDYQIEGFHYLSRLTNWGIGACLADDMGLGKTVQTIALLLEKAPNGAQLVIAPTSVCFNWIEEVNKFAPSLKVYNLLSGNRNELVQNAGPLDVFLCSYGLVQFNTELLADKAWETVVLDEAQAIKNANTKRWKSIMKLKGKNRIALSGTPIENHLGELWSVFSFINPGMLGSIKSFQEKYATPIEIHASPAKIQALKSMVSPYILRRLKSEVLTELPPKTEQTIHVEQSKEESAFYEALRKNAEEKMALLLQENNRFAVLAEITKLRLACCDSTLVDPTISFENSKINAFVETVTNLIDNGHKALVFSQYVSFLEIIKARLDKEKITYQYLDGSTAAAKRRKIVHDFQEGAGDLFLLSLKAGGSGLNLTAADYVIHMDPWWNPAVEDQASDRAHRMGQERPVTIYRFIMQNTIEEKIIALHQKKRDLAENLLNGQGISGKLSSDDLMNLINNSFKADENYS